MRARVERVKAALAGIDSTPRVFVSEWIEPPYAAGHWVPDMVSLAGGMEVAGMSRAPSHRMRWPDVAELEPDVVVLAPCGFDLDRTLDEIVTLDVSAHLLGTPARRESRVFAVDANGYFSRPGPRLVDGIELLAYLLHSDRYSDPGIPWAASGCSGRDVDPDLAVPELGRWRRTGSSPCRQAPVSRSKRQPWKAQTSVVP